MKNVRSPGGIFLTHTVYKHWYFHYYSYASICKKDNYFRYCFN